MGKSVTVFMLVYNGEKYLHQSLDSLLCQDYDNFKIVLINDASKDNSVKIIEEYMQRDRRISLINRPVNGGVAACRNSGFDKLDTEYFTFLDCDDWYEPNYISTLVGLHDENTVFTACGFRYEKRSNKHFKNKREIIKEFNIDEALCEVVTDKNLFGFTWNKMYKTSCLKRLKFSTTVGPSEDLIFNIHFLLNNIDSENATVKCTNQKLYHYVKTKGHVSGMSCNLEKFNKQKLLFVGLEEIKTLPKLKNKKDFCSKINSWIFLSSLQYIIYSKMVKLPDEKKHFKTLAKKYLPDYKKQRKNYSTFRAHGVLLHNLIKMFIW